MASHSLPIHALTVITEPCLPVVFEAELELASDFAKASKSKATLQAYGSDFRIFEGWCRGRGLTALPASSESVVAFLAAQATAGKRASTLQRRLAAIGYMHKIANAPSPVGDERIKATLSGIRRSIGAAPVRKKAATSDIVLSMTGTLGGESLRQLRDRAILLIGFASAMRRSELVALNLSDLEWTAEGVMIRISRSKTDQEGLGQSVAVPRGATACPVAALKAWIEAAGITDGAVFRRIFNKKRQRVTDQRLHGRCVASIVKKGAARLGFDASTFGAHSLRSGLVTSAVKRGVSLLKICDVHGRAIERYRDLGAAPAVFPYPQATGNAVHARASVVALERRARQQSRIEADPGGRACAARATSDGSGSGPPRRGNGARDRVHVWDDRADCGPVFPACRSAGHGAWGGRAARQNGRRTNEANVF